MKICPSCGNELNENAVVCVKCGTALPEKSEIKSSESLLLKFIKNLKIELIIFVISCTFNLIISAISRYMDYSNSLAVGALGLISIIFSILEFAGIMLMLVSAFQFGKYLSTKK